MEMPALTIPKKTERSLDLAKVTMFGPPVVAVLVAILVAFFVVWPKYNQVQQLKVSNKTLEENTTKLEDKATRLAKINTDELKVQRTAAERLLPSDKDIFVSLRQVESVRNASGVVITSLSVGAVGQFSSGESVPQDAADAAAVPPPTTPQAAASATVQDLGDVSAVTIKASMTSDFDQIFSFLNSLYALPRVTTVSGLTFAIDQDGLINTSMDINSLWQELPSEIASVEAPLPTLTPAEVDLLKKVGEGSSVAAPVEVPNVPIGKGNIFAN